MRRIITHLLIVSVAAVLIGESTAASSNAAYTYYEKGGSGPSKWDVLSMSNNQCPGAVGTGFGQSPIGIPLSVVSKCDSFTNTTRTFSFERGDCTLDDMEFDVSKGGIRAQPRFDSMCSMGTMTVPPKPNSTFQAIQFHVHSVAEHAIGGIYHPAELHIVHQEMGVDDPMFAVFGTTIAVGSEDNQFMERLLHGWTLESVLQKLECQGKNISDDELKQQLVSCTDMDDEHGHSNNFESNASINFYDMLSTDNFGVFTYSGGLTTPPCTERVYWHLLDVPLNISQRQLAVLQRRILCSVDTKTCKFDSIASIGGSTARPIQPINGRQLLHYCGPSRIQRPPRVRGGTSRARTQRNRRPSDGSRSRGSSSRGGSSSSSRGSSSSSRGSSSSSRGSSASSRGSSSSSSSSTRGSSTTTTSSSTGGSSTTTSSSTRGSSRQRDEPSS